MTTTYPPSTKQLAFIETLKAERAVSAELAAKAPVTSKDASALIADLLKAPKHAKVAATTKTSALVEIPPSKYALEVNGVIRFYEVVQRKNGARYLNALVGAPGAWAWRTMNPGEYAQALKAIAANPLEAAKRYGVEFTCCGVCGSPLSDPFSVANQIGPICIKKF
jgi:hypothetical protein